MAIVTASNTTALAEERFISVTTFKRNGKPVPTPVWCAGEDGSLLVYSEADSGKVKRIRHDMHVLVAPCTARGKPLGPAVDGDAMLVEDSRHVEALLAAKYRWLWPVYNRLMAAARLLRRQPTPKAIAIRITLRPPGT